MVPGAASLSDLYTAVTQVVAVVNVVNASATATSFRVSVAVGGAADNAKQYHAYDIPITGNGKDKVLVTLAIGDVVRVYATLATLTFTLYGVKIS